MIFWRPVNAIGRSSNLDGCLAAIASRLSITAGHLAIAARHCSVIATQRVVGKADFLDPLFSLHPALRGEKKIQTTAMVLSSSSSTPSRTPPTPPRYPPPARAR